MAKTADSARVRRKPVRQWHERRFEDRPGAVRVTCRTCGRAMWLPPCHAHRYKSCSVECQKVPLRAAKERLTRPCETCGKLFTPRAALVKRGMGRFCSQKCNTAIRAALTPEVYARAAQTYKANLAAGKFSRPRGEDNPMWRGGPKARVARQLADGTLAARTRAYRKKNPHKVREFSQRRKGRKTGRLPRGTIPAILKAQKGKCAICATKLPPNYHTDHITPLAKGGLHEPRNIQLLCPPCNTRKSAKDPVDYMREIGRLI